MAAFPGTLFANFTRLRAENDRVLNPWQRFREQMPITRRLVYLDHAATAPISGPASEAVQAWSRQAAELGDTVWPEWEERANQVRRTAAGLIGAVVEEVALVPNTSAGIGLVARGFLGGRATTSSRWPTNSHRIFIPG